MEKVGGLPASLFLVGRAVHSWLFALQPRVSRPLGCCRTKIFGVGCFQIAHDVFSHYSKTKRHTHTHRHSITHQSSFPHDMDMLGSRFDSCICFCHSGERVRSPGQIRLRVLGCSMVQSFVLLRHRMAMPWYNGTSLFCSFLFSHALPSCVVYFETFWCFITSSMFLVSVHIYNVDRNECPLITKTASSVPECKEKLAASQEAAADAAGQAVLEDAVLGVSP